MSVVTARLMVTVVETPATLRPAIMLIIVPVLVTVTLLAAFVPARRAARTDPTVALRVRRRGSADYSRAVGALLGDVGMAESPGGLSLPFEACEEFGPVREPRLNDFDRDRARRAEMSRTIDRAQDEGH